MGTLQQPLLHRDGAFQGVLRPAAFQTTGLTRAQCILHSWPPSPRKHGTGMQTGDPQISLQAETLSPTDRQCLYISLSSNNIKIIMASAKEVTTLNQSSSTSKIKPILPCLSPTRMLCLVYDQPLWVLQHLIVEFNTSH